MWKADLTVQKFTLHLFSKLSKYFNNYLFIWLLSGHFLTVPLQSFLQCENYLLLKPFPQFYPDRHNLAYLSLPVPKGLNLGGIFQLV